ncbi:MAG: helix-turn-helix domain-containing protein [Bdellovibrionota bacterium]
MERSQENSLMKRPKKVQSSQRSPNSLRILHPIESLGIESVQRGAIRVEKLSERLKPRVPFPHKHDFYQLVLVSSGSGWHEIDFHRYPVGAGRVFIQKPGQIHAWNLAKSSQGFVIEFTLESLPRTGFPADWLSHTPDSFLLKPRAGKTAAKMAEAMLNEFNDRGAHSALALESQLKILLLHFYRQLGGSKTLQEDSEMERFRSLVEQFHESEHGVEFYAKKLGLSPKILTMRASRRLGKSARSVIHDRVLLEAKRLLVQSNSPISEIGYALGFDDPNYFARFFRTNAKLSPGAFRSSSQAKGKA